MSKVNILNKDINNNKIKKFFNKCPCIKSDYNWIDGIAKMNNYKDIFLFRFLVSFEDNEFVKNFETINGVLIYYTKEYLNSIKDDMISL